METKEVKKSVTKEVLRNFPKDIEKENERLLTSNRKLKHKNREMKKHIRNLERIRKEEKLSILSREEMLRHIIG